MCLKVCNWYTLSGICSFVKTYQTWQKDAHTEGLCSLCMKFAWDMRQKSRLKRYHSSTIARTVPLHAIGKIRDILKSESKFDSGTGTFVWLIFHLCHKWSSPVCYCYWLFWLCNYNYSHISFSSMILSYIDLAVHRNIYWQLLINEAIHRPDEVQSTIKYVKNL